MKKLELVDSMIIILKSLGINNEKKKLIISNIFIKKIKRKHSVYLIHFKRLVK